MKLLCLQKQFEHVVKDEELQCSIKENVNNVFVNVMKLEAEG